MPSLILSLVFASACGPDRPTTGSVAASPDVPSAVVPSSESVVPRPGGLQDVRIDDASKRRAGIGVTTAVAARDAPVIEAYGRVLDPVPLVDALANLEASRDAARAAESQLRRVEALARDGQNASALDAELARVARGRARADLSMADARLASLLGPELARSPELPVMLGRIARLENALVRLDVPVGAGPVDPERNARLSVRPQDEPELSARFVGHAATSDPALPGTGLLYLLVDAPPPIGAPIRALLSSSDASGGGVELPAGAILRDGDRLSVFVEREPGVFEPRAIEASSARGTVYFVRSGLEVGERVVVSGAAALLSERLLSSGSEFSP